MYSGQITIDAGRKVENKGRNTLKSGKSAESSQNIADEPESPEAKQRSQRRVSKSPSTCLDIICKETLEILQCHTVSNLTQMMS
jgi:hypothetical protein